MYISLHNVSSSWGFLKNKKENEIDLKNKESPKSNIEDSSKIMDSDLIEPLLLHQ